MKPKTIYLALCFAGVLLPYWQFGLWVMQHGMNLPLFVRELSVNRISAFFGMDVLVSAVVPHRLHARRERTAGDSPAMASRACRGYCRGLAGLTAVSLLARIKTGRG